MSVASGLINDQPALFPRVDWDLETPRRAIRAELGVEALRRLHRADRRWDAALFIGVWAAVAVATVELVLLPLGLQWVLWGLLQQLGTINCLYSVRHDLFFHRRAAGWLSEPLGVLYSLPLFTTYTKFLGHADHHRHVGWDLFEEEIAHLDRRWKRWLCLTMVGVALMLSGRLRARDVPRMNASFVPPAWFQRKLRREQHVHRLFALALLVGAIVWPHVVISGFLLPMVLFAPIIVMIRVAFQHAETDPRNPFHLSVYHRSSRLLRILFFNTLGDGHLVHHLYPHIPIYNVGVAAQLMHPVIARHRVPERGFCEVLWCFFIRGAPYREGWSSRDES